MVPISGTCVVKLKRSRGTMFCLVNSQVLSQTSPAHEANNRRLKDRVTKSLSNLRLRPSARVTVAPAGIDELSTADTAVSKHVFLTGTGNALTVSPVLDDTAVSMGDVCQATASLSLSNSTGSDVDMCHVFTTHTARSHSMLALNTDSSS